MRRILSLSFALLLTLFLAACDSAEERAEGHYQSALTLLDEGDVDRAIVELRNVFPLVPNHLEARQTLARVLLEEKGQQQAAYSQYLRIVEQYPDDLDARINLSEIAFFAANWEELERHGSYARDIDPENARVKGIAMALDYRDAVENDDIPASRLITSQAAAELDPQNPARILQELVLDGALRAQEFSNAFTYLNTLIDAYPEEQRYWNQRLQVLIALDDQDAIEGQLLETIDRFPNDISQKELLIRYYLSRGELDKTETFLRDLVAESDADNSDARVDLIRFLTELRSPEAARAEIAEAVANESDPTRFIMLGAALDFASGETETAISVLEAAIEGAEPSDQTSDMRVTLAQMLVATNNEVGARALVEETLLETPTHPDALKLNAAWLIDADDTDSAIAALRTALDSNPNDPAAMTLMATAYMRTGSIDLARDFLALAVEESGNAPAETVRYAQLLISEERYLPAEDVLLPALRVTPNDLNLLQTAGQLYLAMDDLGRAQQVVDTLGNIDSEPARRMAVAMEAQLVSQNNGIEEAMQFLENLATNDNANFSARVLLLRAQLSSGDTENAVVSAQSLVADAPDSPAMKMVLATTLAATNDLDGALQVYTDIANDFPNEASVQLAIASVQVRKGDPDAARATVDAALANLPNEPNLQWAKASYLEQDNDIEGAISIYEQMYASDSSNMVVANNLASLIGTYRDDEESLEQAWTIARRFRTSEQPAIQDTYGWLTHRRGNSEEALPYLQAAAEGLSNDVVVQFHLAEVLYALDRREDALAQYRVVLERAGVADTRPQLSISRERVAEIQEALANPEEATE